MFEDAKFLYHTLSGNDGKALDALLKGFSNAHLQGNVLQMILFAEKIGDFQAGKRNREEAADAFQTALDLYTKYPSTPGAFLTRKRIEFKLRRYCQT
jgi:hypothetical protein